MTKFFGLFKTKYHFFLLSLISGIFIGTSYIPLPAWAVLFGYVPLWLGLIELERRNSSLKFIFSVSWLTQFTLTAIGFNWIYYTARVFGYLPVSVSALALIGFAALMHLYIPFSTVVAIWLKRKFNLGTIQLVLLFAILLSGLERVWPSLFPWNLGYTFLWMRWPIFNWADTVGFYGLSTYLLLFQAVLIIALLQKTTARKSAALAANLLFFVILNYTGAWKAQKWDLKDSPDAEQISFTLTQGNISAAQKLEAEFQQISVQDILQVYIKEYDRYVVAKKENDPTFKTDILMWPETAAPIALDKEYSRRSLNRLIHTKLSEWNTMLVTGAFSIDPVKKDILNYPLARNAIFFLKPQADGTILEEQPPYYKTMLLMFGEYMPLGDTFPSLYKLLPFVGTYERGPGPVIKPVTIEGKTVNLGPQICYESLDPNFSRKLALAGTDIIINVTNDDWFGEWQEPFQNMSMTLARAIEVRRPLVRSTNTGISSVMLASGEQLEQTPIDKLWTTTFNVPYLKNAPQTFYSLYGHYDWVLLILGLILILSKGAYARKK